MGSGLSERDGEAISTAIRILTEAGFDVQKVGSGSRSESGVEFRLDINAHTRVDWFVNQSAAVREAAIDAPEFDMGGQVVERDE